MNTYIIPTTFTFTGTFTVKATSKQQARQKAAMHCGMLCGDIQSSLPDEEINWNFPIHPEVSFPSTMRR